MDDNGKTKKGYEKNGMAKKRYDKKLQEKQTHNMVDNKALLSKSYYRNPVVITLISKT